MGPRTTDEATRVLFTGNIERKSSFGKIRKLSDSLEKRGNYQTFRKKSAFPLVYFDNFSLILFLFLENIWK